MLFYILESGRKILRHIYLVVAREVSHTWYRKKIHVPYGISYFYYLSSMPVITMRFKLHSLYVGEYCRYAYSMHNYVRDAPYMEYRTLIDTGYPRGSRLNKKM